MTTRMDSPLDFRTLVTRAKPNDCLMLPDGLGEPGRAHLSAKVFQVTPAALFDAVKAVVTETKGAEKIELDADSRYLRYVAVTRVLRFRDDVDIAVFEAPGEGAALAIYSRSRIGHSDLGTNQKRVLGLQDAVAAKIVS